MRLFVMIAGLLSCSLLLANQPTVPEDLEKRYQNEQLLTFDQPNTEAIVRMSTHFLMDVNGDLDDDLVFIDERLGTVYWELWTSDGFQPGTPVGYTAYVPPYHVADMRPTTLPDGSNAIALIESETGTIHVHGWTQDGLLDPVEHATHTDMIAGTSGGEVIHNGYVTWSRYLGLFSIWRNSSTPARLPANRTPVAVLDAPDVGLNPGDLFCFAGNDRESDTDHNQVLFVNSACVSQDVTDTSFPGLRALDPIKEVHPWAIDATDYLTGTLEDLLIETVTKEGVRKAHIFERVTGQMQWTLEESITLPGVMSGLWLVPIDEDDDDVTDLAMHVYDKNSHSLSWMVWHGVGDGTFTSTTITATTSEVYEDGIGTDFPLETTVENAFSSLGGWRDCVTNEHLPTGSMLTALCKAIDYIKDLGDKLLNDADPGNDEKGQDIKDIGDVLAGWKAGDDISLGGLGGELDGMTKWWLGTGQIILDSGKFEVDAVKNCDWTSEEWWDFLTTLFHEGMHAGGEYGEAPSEEAALCFLEEAEKDVNDPTSSVARQLPGWPVPIGGGYAAGSAAALAVKERRLDELGDVYIPELFAKYCRNRARNEQNPNAINALGQIFFSLLIKGHFNDATSSNSFVWKGKDWKPKGNPANGCGTAKFTYCVCGFSYTRTYTCCPDD